MITRKEAEDRIAAGGTLSRSELSEVLLSYGGMTVSEMDSLSVACPEWVAEQEAHEAGVRTKEEEYLKNEAPLREQLQRLGYPIKSVWDFVNAKQNYYVDAIPILVEHLQRPYNDDVREGIARALAVREARGQAGEAIVVMLRESDLGDQVRWALANTLTIVATPSQREAIEALLETETNRDVADRLRRSLKTAAKP